MTIVHVKYSCNNNNNNNNNFIAMKTSKHVGLQVIERNILAFCELQLKETFKIEIRIYQ